MLTTKLTISTPNGIFFEDDIQSVTLKTPEGYIGLQHNRLPFISTIEISTLFIKDKNGNNKTSAISGGIVFVEKTYIDIFTDDIEWKEQLNKSEIQKLIKETQEKLSKQNIDNIDRNKNELVLKKALNKLTTLNK